MPTISMFYGIIIRMYYFDDQQHHAPHIHVHYQNFKAVYAIKTNEVLSGNIPKVKHKLVDAWIELHRDELMADWLLALEGEAVFKIEPLK